MRTNSLAALALILTLFLAGCATAPPKKTLAQKRAERAKAASAAAVVKPVKRPLTKATGTPDDARRHMLRGMAAIEMAKSSDDLALAEEEFLAATDISPQLGTAWFNLGKLQTQLGRFDEAIASYRQYLTVTPGAEDAQKVRDEIVKLEFRQEQTAREKGRAGSWVGADGNWYALSLDGARIILKTQDKFITDKEILSTYTLVGSVPVTGAVPAELKLTARGNRLAGIWTRGPVKAGKCVVPADTAEVTGEINDKDGKITLRYDATRFTASTQMGLMDDFCSGVVAGDKLSVEETLYGPLGPASLGPDVYYVGLHSWWPGGFSMVAEGWQGHLAVRLDEETEAYVAGLRNNDEILTIDGTPVANLKAGEAMMRLFGQPETPVRLDILREGVKAPITLTILRIPN